MLTALPRMSTQDLYSELPYILRRVFGYTRLDWFLKDIGLDRRQLYSNIYDFLCPTGILWKTLQRLSDDSHHQIRFQYSIHDLPSHIRSKLLTSLDLFKGRLNQSDSSILLDPIEYFLFHLLNYPVCDQSIQAQFRLDSVYLSVLEAYLCLFLPIDVQEFHLLSTKHHIKTTIPILSSPVLQKPRVQPQSYLFGNIGSKRSPQQSPPSMDPFQTSPQLSTTDVNEQIRKIDYFIKAYVEFLIDLYPPQSSSFRSIIVQEFNLSDVHLLSIRMFIKRLHLFCYSNLSKTNNSMSPVQQRTTLYPLQGLKNSCIDLYVRRPLYNLIQIGIVRCPLDSRFNTLLYIWYTYIRPWRFEQLTGLADTTTIDQQDNQQQESQISQEYLSFIEKNYLFYGRLFQLVIDRLQKTDMTNSLIAQLLTKLANVFSSKNFSSIITKADRFSSPSSPETSPQRKLFMNPFHLSPNSSASYMKTTLTRQNSDYSLLSDDTKTLMVSCLRKIHSAIETNAIRIEEQQKLAKERASKTTSVTNSIMKVVHKIYQPKTAPSSTGIGTIISNDIIQQLITVKQKFADLFQIDLNSFESSIVDSTTDNKQLTSSTQQKFFNVKPEQLRPMMYYEQNPETAEPNQFELKPLLWFNQRLSENINLRYGDYIRSLYARKDFLGTYSRQIFYGTSIDDAKINFRHFTDYRTLILLLLSASSHMFQKLNPFTNRLRTPVLIVNRAINVTSPNISPSEKVSSKISPAVIKKFDAEVAYYQQRGHLPKEFVLYDQLYEKLEAMATKTERLVYLRSIGSRLARRAKQQVTSTNNKSNQSELQTVFKASSKKNFGIYSGFSTIYQFLKSSDLTALATWNYLKAHRLQEFIIFNCSNLNSSTLAQFLQEMRVMLNEMKEPWWPILTNVTKETEDQMLIDMINKLNLNETHFLWQTEQCKPSKLMPIDNLTLVCHDRGYPLHEIDYNTTYVLQLDSDNKRCYLGNGSDENDQEIKLYKNVVKLEPRTQGYSRTLRVSAADAIHSLTLMKGRVPFYDRKKKIESMKDSPEPKDNNNPSNADDDEWSSKRTLLQSLDDNLYPIRSFKNLSCFRILISRVPFYEIECALKMMPNLGTLSVRGSVSAKEMKYFDGDVWKKLITCSLTKLEHFQLRISSIQLDGNNSTLLRAKFEEDEYWLTKSDRFHVKINFVVDLD
ncbi:unnamed protein product [Didymodactylos carnosus]|uniref:Uncharacterized protein n=1 Tax=Didymodactylos carnosus TaxID=1234261 RepID=A0A813TLJ2_9BILA|nr:unnamed protein product [Didymodactylos carnosus]CAF0813445.1 unnamed protein product [Didymodactylos carnosus]CAF3517782.1 unnamed protein product [Didymodactylos carnosus]CAF3599331.1 unnamed protein product [Didymodactylos carnosus]